MLSRVYSQHLYDLLVEWCSPYKGLATIATFTRGLIWITTLSRSEIRAQENYYRPSYSSNRSLLSGTISGAQTFSIWKEQVRQALCLFDTWGKAIAEKLVYCTVWCMALASMWKLQLYLWGVGRRWRWRTRMLQCLSVGELKKSCDSILALIISKWFLLD